LGFSSFESQTGTQSGLPQEKSFNSLLGFSSFESEEAERIIIDFYDNTFNSLLGFSSFESTSPILRDTSSLTRLSIPYWDFLVLNLTAVRRNLCTVANSFNSLLGFSSFESYENADFQVKIKVTFNSLLGFSSFESIAAETMGHRRRL